MRQGTQLLAKAHDSPGVEDSNRRRLMTPQEQQALELIAKAIQNEVKDLPDESPLASLFSWMLTEFFRLAARGSPPTSS